MSASQKHAWFNLAVIALTLAAVAGLRPVLGEGAYGAFGFLGLMGFGPFFFRRRDGRVLADERDVQIQRRATLAGFTAFWAVFIAVAVLLPLWYGPEGVIPVLVVSLGAVAGTMLFVGVTSVAALVQYAGGGDVRQAAR